MPLFDYGFEPPAAMQEMPEPHFAHDIVVLVEGRGVDAERDAAAAPHRLRIGAMPLLRCRFELGLVAMTAPAAAIASSSAGRA